MYANQVIIMHVLVERLNEVLVWSIQDVYARMSSMTTYYRNNSYLKNVISFTRRPIWLAAIVFAWMQRQFESNYLLTFQDESAPRYTAPPPPNNYICIVNAKHPV